MSVTENDVVMLMVLERVVSGGHTIAVRYSGSEVEVSVRPLGDRGEPMRWQGSAQLWSSAMDTTLGRSRLLQDAAPWR